MSLVGRLWAECNITNVTNFVWWGNRDFQRFLSPLVVVLAEALVDDSERVICGWWFQKRSRSLPEILENIWRNSMKSWVSAVQKTASKLLALTRKVFKLPKTLLEDATKILETKSQTQRENEVSELPFMLDQENWSCAEILATQS